MLSFQQLYNTAQSLVGDNSTTTTTFLKLHINIGNQKAETKLGSYFIEENGTDLTEVGVDSYPLPDRCIRPKKIYVTVSGIRYPAVFVYNEVDWQRIKYNGSQTKGNFLTHVFIRRNSFEMYPTPSTANNTITIIHESSYRFMAQDDYTTGTITTLANDGIVLTGSSSEWDATFAGRQFKINAYPIWYPILSYTSATSLTLAKPYQGTAISAGSAAYTIGEFSRLPPSMHILPVYYAVAMYYNTKKDLTNMATFMGMFDAGLADGIALYGKRDSSSYIPSQRHIRQGAAIDPNDYPSNLT